MEYLHAVVASVSHGERPERGGHGRARRRRKLPVARAGRAELGNEAVASKVGNLHAVVARVGDDKASIVKAAPIEGSRAVELQVARAGRAERIIVKEIPRGSHSGNNESLDAVVARVGDEDNVEGAYHPHHYAPGAVELPVARAVRTELGKVRTVRAKELHPVVASVGDQDAAMVRGMFKRMHVRRRRELAVARAAPPELEGERAVRVEHLDAVVAGVGDVYQVGVQLIQQCGQLTPHENSRRRRELAVARAAPPELEGERAVRVEHLDAVVAGVGDVDGAVVRQDDGLRRRELPVGGGLGLRVAGGRRGCRERRQRSNGGKQQRRRDRQQAGRGE